VIIALNGNPLSSHPIFYAELPFLPGPQEATVGEIRQFQKLFLYPGFVAYAAALIMASLAIIFYFAPRSVSICNQPPPLAPSGNQLLMALSPLFRYGKKSMLWYIFVCSMIGGISVSVTTGLGAAIVTTAMGDNQVSCHC